MQLLDSRHQNHSASVRSRRLRTDIFTWLWFTAVMGLCLVFGFFMLNSGPTLSHIAWFFYLAGVVAIFIQPRYGIYLVIFLSLIGDGNLSYSLPFTKNFSSAESLLYLSNALVFSPLETYIAFTFVSWLGRGAMQRKIVFYRSELFWPAIVFLGFIIFGLVYGIGKGGNLTIALWESRPIFYLVAMLILASNLFTERNHFHTAMWSAMLAIFIEGIIGSHYFFVTLHASLAGVDAITDHSAAIHINTFIVFMLSAWLYNSSKAKLFLLPLMAPPVLLTYLATQRRAAYISIIIALGLMTLVLYKENRRAFWLLVPAAAVVGVLYMGAFWNSNGALGQPVQAIKSVVAEDQANAADQSSDVYRFLENLNTGFTIHQRPLTGVGFGQKFYVVWEMPDISFFEWWQYFPHNSIIWIWLKAGVGGFVAMLYLVGKSIMVGSRAVMRIHKDPMGAIALTGVLYIIMHFVFAYVDISWDPQSMVYIGMTMGILGAIEKVLEQPEPHAPVRWSWQRPQAANLTIRPLPIATSKPITGAVLNAR